MNGAHVLAIAFVLVSTAAWAEAPKPRTAAKPPPPKYGTYVRNWHTPTVGKLPSIDAAGRPMLAVFSLNTNDRVELSAVSDNGGFSARDLDRAAFVLREPASGNEHPIEPRMLDVLYRSGPGRRNRERGIMGDLAKKSDERAAARGEHATPAFAVANDVDAVLRAHAIQPPTTPTAPEEDEDTETP
jgi:hypothetical protein